MGGWWVEQQTTCDVMIVLLNGFVCVCVWFFLLLFSLQNMQANCVWFRCAADRPAQHGRHERCGGMGEYGGIGDFRFGFRRGNDGGENFVAKFVPKCFNNTNKIESALI